MPFMSTEKDTSTRSSLPCSPTRGSFEVPIARQYSGSSAQEVWISRRGSRTLRPSSWPPSRSARNRPTRKDARKSGTEREKRRKQTSTQTREKGPPFDPEAEMGKFHGEAPESPPKPILAGVKNIHNFPTQLSYTTFLHNFSTQLFYTTFLHNFSTQFFYTTYLHIHNFPTQYSYTTFLHIHNFPTQLFYTTFFFAGKWTGGQPR